MDNKAMYKLSYGLYIVGSAWDGKVNAQIANTVFQINSDPVTVAVSLNNRNYTKEMVEKSGVFSVNVLSDKADMAIIGNFGFKSGRSADKFADYNYTVGETGAPLLSLPQIAAHLEARVIEKLTVGTHTLFIGKVVDAVDLPQQQMTYADYHKLKNSSAAPAKASGGKKYRCKICGYIHEGELPKDFICPICGVGADMFEEVAEPKAEPKYRCKVCGYVHEGELPKDFICPICGVGTDMFEKI